MQEKNIAIVDMGSNSVRIVIYSVNQRGAAVKIDDLKRSIRLSSHITKGGAIDDDGIRQLLHCLRQFKQLCDSRSVESIKGVATAALRQAKNRNDILFEIVKETGIQFEILSGEAEARYGYLAVRASMDIDEAIIVDVGGGSTEISYMRDRILIQSVSLPYGAVNITDKYYKGMDIISRRDAMPALSDLSYELSKAPWLAGKQCPIIALGGTARSLACIHQAKRRYSFNSIHNYKMDSYDIKLIFHFLRRTSLMFRGNIEGLSSGREDIIVGGLTMYKAIIDHMDTEEFYVSSQGIRDGICHEIVMQESNEQLDTDIVQMHMRRFAYNYKINQSHAEHVMELSLTLYRRFIEEKLIPYGEYEAKLLKVAAFLHDIGRSINVYNTSDHTFYLLTNVNLLGLTHKERLLIALIASYKKSKVLRNRIGDYDDILRDSDEPLIRLLGEIVLFARVLDRTTSKQVLEVRVLLEEQRYVIECVTQKKRSIELDTALEQVRRLKKVLGRELTVRAIKK